MISLKQFAYYTGTFLGLLSLVAVPVSAVSAKTAAATTSGSSTTSSQSAKAAAKAASQAAANQARLQLIISRGNLEIDRRLTTLNTLSSKIASATKLTSSDAATLNNTVTTDISALTTLKTNLDSATSVSTAVTDAQSIILDYRVYALVVPQVNIVKAADDQQATETKLSALASKLSTRISGSRSTSLQSDLSDMNAKITAAQGISSNMETSVITLVPSDYNTNHGVLTGDRNQLLTAQTDINDALNDAQQIISQLPSS